MQLVRTGQRIVDGETVRERRDWLVKQVEDRTLNAPPQWLRQGLYLLPGRSGETDEAITH